MVTFVIPMKIRSQNYTHYRAWYVAANEKKRWLKAMALICGRGNTTRKMALRIISNRSRLLDYGNLVGGCKPILDCLKQLGWLVDDSPTWVSDTYEQVKVNRCEECTVIEITTV